MEKYRVIEDILKGRTFNEPHRDSKKVVAKAGTILVAKHNPEKIGNPLELYTTGGRFICQVGSQNEKEKCVKIDEDIPVTDVGLASLEDNLFAVFKEYLDDEQQSYDNNASLEELKELVGRCNPAASTFVIATLYSEALDKIDNKQ